MFFTASPPYPAESELTMREHATKFPVGEYVWAGQKAGLGCGRPTASAGSAPRPRRGYLA
jgi:hypothetical protein